MSDRLKGISLNDLLQKLRINASGVGLAALALTACVPQSSQESLIQPTPKAAPTTPRVLPTFGPAIAPTLRPEILPIPKVRLSEQEKTDLIKAVLNTKNYSKEKLEAVENLSREGNIQPSEFELTNGHKIRLDFSKIATHEGSDFSNTNVNMSTSKIEGEDILVVHFGITTAQHIQTNFPQEVTDVLIKREAVTVLLQLTAWDQMLSSKGIDLSKPLDPQLKAQNLSVAEFSSLVDQMLQLVGPYAYAIPKIQESIKIFKFLERSPSGTVPFKPYQSRHGKVFLAPSINSTPYTDNGKMYSTLKSFGEVVSNSDDISDLNAQYTSFDQLTNWNSFLEIFKSN